MEKIHSIKDEDYLSWVSELKKRYKESQNRAAIKVNSELIRFYLMLGKDIVAMKAESKWGLSFFEVLSTDLKRAFPHVSGFSPSNLAYMKRFYLLFENEFYPQAVGEIENKTQRPDFINKICSIPWGHIRAIIDKCWGRHDAAIFYVESCFRNSWSRAILMNQISSCLYERQGKALTNFDCTLPESTSSLASQITKDPYIFDFIEMREHYDERELKDALIKNVENYLLELGTGFAYMGKEFRIKVGSSEEFIDMLFYNTKVHAYVVIEIKIRDFQPGDIGQLSTYVVAVNHLLKSERDEKTIGLLVCKEKDQIIANYALESSSQPIGVSSYELSKLIPETFKSTLPTIEELEEELNGK